MAATKRPLDDTSSSRKTKKTKTSGQFKSDGAKSVKQSVLVAEEIDFPRGGGTTFTPLEVKAIRAEAVKEADEALFKEAQQDRGNKKKSKKFVAKDVVKSSEKGGNIRIEHLNYKRMFAGMKILGQIVSIMPLGLIISLPNQLYGHVPITQISSQFTTILERFDAHATEDSNEDNSGEETDNTQIPDLFEMFRVGQYVRAVVTNVHAAGVSDMSGLGKLRDDLAKASKRVELSLSPEKVNAGVQKSDLQRGFTLSAAVKSIEDHGYNLELGVPDVSGFLPFEGSPVISKLSMGGILDAIVTKVSSNGRLCSVSLDGEKYSTLFLSEVSSVNSVLPGSLAQCLVTSINPDGINLQVLGFFDGTVDLFHLPKAPQKLFKVGKKVRARILYNYSSSPPKFALALSDHVVHLRPKLVSSGDEAGVLQEVFPLGTVLDAVKVLRVEKERGLIVEVKEDQEGFVHISHLSDDHVLSLTSSGPWKPGTIHRARVTGYFAFDGLLQLSLKQSVLEQRYIQVTDVVVGEVVKGTIKKLTESALFVSLSGSVDGVVWPNHYADIILKHPAKRFKVGASIKCRILVVDPEKKRISLTAKKTLLDSPLPILSSLEQVRVGAVTHAVIFKVHDKHLLVEFYNNLKAFVPLKEVSETPVANLAEVFPVGKVVKVRITAVEQDEGRIVASIRKVSPAFDSAVADISEVEVGNVVEGVVKEIHKDNAILLLQPIQVRALLSLKNLANRRGISLPQLKTELKIGEKLSELVVVTRNSEKGFVIVANAPKTKATLLGKTLTIDTINVGQILGGRVTRHIRQGALVKVTTQIGGIIHPSDVSDNFDVGNPYPAVDSLVKAAVVSVDKDKKQVVLSTRQSRLRPDQQTKVVDREIHEISDLSVGDTVRGFVKSVAEHGLFVTIGRNIDARVQIRELFDEFVKEWKPQFQVNQVVKGRILSVDTESKKVELTFRSGDLSTRQSTTQAKRSPSDLRVGEKVEGVIKRIEDYGLFIQIKDSKMSGLCHKSELSDNQNADVSVALQNFREGDRVKAAIINVDKKRISLSLKPSHFSPEELAEQDADNGSDTGVDQRPSSPFGVVDAGMMGNDEGKNVEDIEMQSAGESSEGDDDDVMDVDESAVTQLSRRAQKQDKNSSAIPAPVLSLGGGFKWHGFNDPQETDGFESNTSDSEDSGDEGRQSHKKKKRKRKGIEQDLTEELHTKTPESNADFERVLLGSPNSSYVWIQYMSFQLQLSEIDKAREIGRRAFKTIHFREEQERLNVSIALLNLENIYGTDESLDATFKEAARSNDSKTIHIRLASILEQSGKYEKAVEQYQKTCKKFGASSKVWTLFAEFYLKSGNLEEARKLLPRGFQSLEKRKHIKTASSFAQLEYKHGDPERGKTIFEGIIDSHPKRWDIWSIYIDMEASQRNVPSIRYLFDRVLAIKMTSHKAKSFFKKWLGLERRFGDEEGADTVKQKAIEWTQRAANNAS